MTSKVIQYDKYNVVLTIKEDQIYIKILDTINFTTYECSFDSQYLQLSNKLSQIYTMIEKTLEKENNFNVTILLESDIMKLIFNITLESFFDVNFDIVLHQNIPDSQELTLKLNNKNYENNMLLNRIEILEKENYKLLDENEKEKQNNKKK
jgi:hypothetical protein